MNKTRLYWDMISPTIGIFFIAAAMFFAMGILLSIPLCLLWNWLMPFIFGLPKLNLLQTFGLSLFIRFCSFFGNEIWEIVFEHGVEFVFDFFENE